MDTTKPWQKSDVEIQPELRQFAGNVGVQFFLGDALENLQVGIARALRVCRSWQQFSPR